MTVLLSLCLALIEGVRSNAIRTETECVVNVGMNSILAEYHRELLKQYNLFGVDASYGTENSGLDSMTQHLIYYLEKNFSIDNVFLSQYLYRDFLAIEVDSVNVTAASIMTDSAGAVFRQNAIEAIKDDCNLVLLEELQQWLEVIKEHELNERDVAAEKNAIDKQIAQYNGNLIQVPGTETTKVAVSNPTADLEKIRSAGILEHVVDVNALSTKGVLPENLIYGRMQSGQVNKGNIPLQATVGSDVLWERFFFQEYLMKYMGHYGKEKEGSALSYQIEYLLVGKGSDVDNLTDVANLLCAVREAANAIYIFSDKEKCAEAEAIAVVVAALVQMPDLASLLQTAILLGWAYAESIYDVEVLLSGGSVPLMKDKTTWHYDIENALKLEDTKKTNPSVNGLTYEDYLRIFMMLTDINVLTGRGMDMVEADIRLTPGNVFFRLDNCYEQVEFCISIHSKYGYQYEITRRKGYQ